MDADPYSNQNQEVNKTPETPELNPIFEKSFFNLTSSSRNSVTGHELFDILSREDLFETKQSTRSKTAVYKKSTKSLSMKNVDAILGELKVNMFSIEDLEEEENQYTVNKQQSISENNQDQDKDNLNNNYVQENNTETPKNSLNSINDNLNNLIDSKLREMKDTMLNKVDKYKLMLSLKYDEHIDKTKRNVLQKANRIKQVFNKNNSFNNINNNCKNENSTSDSNEKGADRADRADRAESPKKELEYMRRYTFKNVGDKLDQIFDIHDKIESSIEKNFEILGNFLDNFDLFHDNPLESFVNDNAEDILSSWIFSKINFEKIDTINLIENDKIPHVLKNFIFQDTVNKFSMITVNKAKNYDFEKKLMFDNHLILEKLRMKNLEHNEFLKIFSQVSAIEGIHFNKVKEVSFYDCKIESVMFNNLFPNTEKIIMKNCLLKFNPQNLSRDFSKLKILSITKSNLSNKNLNDLFEDFANSNELLENLQTLTLSNNKISVVDMSPLFNKNKKFDALQVLVLSKNKIYKFKSENFKCLPSLKLLNLSFNNFTSGKDLLELVEKSKKFTKGAYISMNKNLFLLNNKNSNKEYIEYLIENLQNFDFFLRNLDISYIFNNLNREQLNKINLNSNMQISIKKINLSFSTLNSNLIMNFIKSNSGFINLRRLNISNNLLDDTFLDKYVSENFINLLENLEVINLSCNQITDSSINNLDFILKNQKKIQKIKLNHNPIENSLIQYLNTYKRSSSEVILDDAIKLMNEENSEYIPQQDLFGDFVENLFEIKKDFKLVFSKSCDSFYSNSTSNKSGEFGSATGSAGFISKKSRLINKIFNFE